MLGELIIAFLLAATPWVELLVVVPLGIARGLDPILLGAVVITGNTATILPVLWLHGRWRTWRAQRAATRAAAANPAPPPVSGASGASGVSGASEAENHVHTTPPDEPGPVSELAASAEGDPRETPIAEETDDSFSTRRGARAQRLWQRYGLPGVALLAPLVTGVHLAAAVALVAGATRRAVFIWFTASIVLWTIGVTVISILGVEGFRRLWPG